MPRNSYSVPSAVDTVTFLSPAQPATFAGFLVRPLVAEQPTRSAEQLTRSAEESVPLPERPTVPDEQPLLPSEQPTVPAERPVFPVAPQAPRTAMLRVARRPQPRSPVAQETPAGLAGPAPR